jgi:hypothetical protein
MAAATHARTHCRPREQRWVGRSGRFGSVRSASAVTAVRWAGKIVPVEVTVRLLKKAMDESGKTKFLIDGFPRNMNNVDVRPNSDSHYKSTGNP